MTSLDNYVNDLKEEFEIPKDKKALSLFTFLRTYSRRKNNEDSNSLIETWKEALLRVVKACNTQLNCGFTVEEQKKLFKILFNRKASVAGRFLWSLGSSTVEKCGLTSLQNCAVVQVDSPVSPFTWTMNMLMLGTGVGFTIFKKDMTNIPPVKKVNISRNDVKDADFIVPDSREGWIKLLEETLRAHFETGKSFTYSCLLLRSAGEPIKGFGGTASGPVALCEGIQHINSVLNNREGLSLRPIDALDIMCIIAQIVVSGNTRRSALLSLGDCEDEEYLNAKNWGSGTVPNWRANVNCSIECSDFEKVINNKNFWKLYDGSSEPYGLINLKLHRDTGRIGDTQYLDPDVIGVNPCAEQSLSNHETCCLGEIYLPNILTKEELFECCEFIYKVCKHSLTLECKDSKETEDVVHKNMRMGLGITGYLQASETQKNWLSDTYKHLREYDIEYSKKHNFPPSIKLTTVKPSGCSRGDSLIQTSEGLLRLDEIGDVNGDEWQEIKNLNVNTEHNDEECVSKFYKNGFVDTKIITTQDGIEFESSLEHRYRVITDNHYEWKHVHELKIGDVLAVSLGGHPTLTQYKLLNLTNEFFTEPILLTEEVASFAGWYYACKNGLKSSVNVSAYTFKYFSEQLDLDSVKLDKWFKFNFISDDMLSKNIRCSRESVVKAFLRLLDNRLENTKVNSQLEILARSVGGINTEGKSWNDFYTDKIVNIVDSQNETYDISVNNTHHYKLNGVVSHNTLSILGGTTSGSHCAYSQYYIRRIRISSHSPLLKIAQNNGYKTEPVYKFDGSIDHTTSIIEFPYSFEDGVPTADKASAVQQLETCKRLQTEWSDNAVSCTISYKLEELEEIKEWFKQNYNSSVKSASFLLHSGHSFQQSPIEPITKEQYLEIFNRVKPIEDLTGICFDADDEVNVNVVNCSNGVCSYDRI